MSTTAPINGLHHVTAICGDPVRNHAFYTRVLGLRFVKKTVNHDDPSAYHLYYGNEHGAPGTALTFFAWPDLGKGRPGAGEATATLFSVPPGSLAFWRQRLSDQGAAVAAPSAVLGDERLWFDDPDGLRGALVVVEDDDREPWIGSGVAADVAIRGFHGIRLTVTDGGAVAALLTGLLDYRSSETIGGIQRFVATTSPTAGLVEIDVQPSGLRAGQGVGSIHHVAFRVADPSHQESIRRELGEAGMTTTGAIDRTYFTSIYFRAPGGVLFEIATDAPGFTADEPLEELGTNLKLPPRHEPHRAEIERRLPPLRI